MDFPVLLSWSGASQLRLLRTPCFLNIALRRKPKDIKVSCNIFKKNLKKDLYFMIYPGIPGGLRGEIKRRAGIKENKHT